MFERAKVARQSRWVLFVAATLYLLRAVQIFCRLKGFVTDLAVAGAHAVTCR